MFETRLVKHSFALNMVLSCRMVHTKFRTSSLVDIHIYLNKSLKGLIATLDLKAYHPFTKLDENQLLIIVFPKK